VVHQYEITYPRQWHFADSATFFAFGLPANAAGNYLEITRFNSGTSVPVLYDLTNGRRYTAVVSGPVYKFALEPSAVDRKLVLLSTDPVRILNPGRIQSRQFTDFSQPANQSDYMIITAASLMNGANGANPVEEYRSYRASAEGGGYNARIHLVDEIVDQFGFGIKQNPAALRNFIRYARLHYAIKPKMVFLIGKGVNYRDARTNEAKADISLLHLVPTFGYPASDMLLTAEPGSSKPLLPIGRLSAVFPSEVQVYLKKVKEHDQAYMQLSPNITDRAWMKNVVHTVGASDKDLGQILTDLMNTYKKTITDTSFGANVSTFTKTSGNTAEQLTSAYLGQLFTQGISLITYFGHSSASTLDFNLDNPENYVNPGKYPLFIALGCNAGDFFTYKPLRLQTKETLSEKYVFAQDRGTIGFIASTHFGIVHYLDIWNARAYRSISELDYGKTIGEIMMSTAHQVFDFTSEDDYYARTNVEETELHGDPAVRINPMVKPDYTLDESMVRITPGFISVADETFRVEAKFLNIGKAINKNIVVQVKRDYPNGTSAIVYRDTLEGIRYADSISVNIPIDPNLDKGANKITVTIDADNTVDEYYETNNAVTKEFVIFEDEARPVYPYNFAIVNKPDFKLIASTANPFSPVKEYRMEIDTTEAFNSPLKVVQTVQSVGGAMEFNPGLNFTDNTVYYWRVSPVQTNGSFNWNSSSFIYMENEEVGFNQSHLFQHFKSRSSQLSLDSTARNWKYGEITNNLFLRMGTWTVSTSAESQLTVAVNTQSYIRSCCWFSSLV
ncbi:MAG TPA: C25 family cysteine peptidase, partial [Chitinophagaceae bacterium]|nr:C25 family cysteine peptidase [Chitinophagaceae bacterium]